MNIHIFSFYTAYVNFRTDERPDCCPYYFPKGNTCEGMFNILPKILKKKLQIVSSDGGYALPVFWRKKNWGQCVATLRLQHDGP